MISSSPGPARQFRSAQPASGRPPVSNLDRCAGCGNVRSAHGPDGACAPAVWPRAVTLAVTTVVGGLLGAGVTWALVTSDHRGAGSVAAAIVLYLIILGLAGFIAAGDES